MKEIRQWRGYEIPETMYNSATAYAREHQMYFLEALIFAVSNNLETLQAGYDDWCRVFRVSGRVRSG